MILTIDVGNTNTRLGVFDGSELVADWRLDTRLRRSDDQLGVLMRQLFASAGLEASAIAGAIYACVVPTLGSVVSRAVERHIGPTPLVVGPGIKTQMPILLDNPREVGADRIANAVAAYARWQTGLVVVDLGTATTFDAITPSGQYLGGAIAPGMLLSAEALAEATARLPRVELKRPDTVVGRHTTASMQAGIFFGYVGLIDEIVGRMEEELSFETTCVATGSHAALLADDSATIEHVVPHLTLDGLRILYERNSR